MQEMWVQSLGQEDPLQEEVTTHSSILAWRIPWTEEGRVEFFRENKNRGAIRVSRHLAGAASHLGQL